LILFTPGSRDTEIDSLCRGNWDTVIYSIERVSGDTATYIFNVPGTELEIKIIDPLRGASGVLLILDAGHLGI
jgi:hypothetical protein